MTDQTDIPAWALREAAKVYGFIGTPDFTTLFHRQYELIESIARALITTAENMRGRATAAATTAQLPDGYIWGHDAMEQFDFGKRRAAEAIAALPIEDEKTP